VLIACPASGRSRWRIKVMHPHQHTAIFFAREKYHQSLAYLIYRYFLRILCCKLLQPEVIFRFKMHRKVLGDWALPGPTGGDYPLWAPDPLAVLRQGKWKAGAGKGQMGREKESSLLPLIPGPITLPSKHTKTTLY